MKKNRRVVVALLTLVTLLLSVPGIANAAQLFSSPPSATEDQISKGPHKSIVIYTRSVDEARSGAVLIKMWGTGIADNYNGTVTINGLTQTYSTVNSLSATVYLQRWNGSAWVDVTSRTYSRTNDFLVSDSSNITVTRGDYYRTRSVHQASLNGSSDATSAVSESIYVN